MGDQGKVFLPRLLKKLDKVGTTKNK